MSTNTRTEHANACAVSQEPSAISSMMRRIERMIDRGIGDKAGGIRKADLPSRATIRKYTVSIAPIVQEMRKHTTTWVATGNRPLNLKLSESEHARIVELAKAGASYIQIAVEIDVHPNTIRSFCKRHGVKVRLQTGGLVTPKIDADLRKLHASGVALHVAARKFGFNAGVVRGWEDRTGLRFKRVYAVKGPRKERYSKYTAKVESMYRKGASMAEACKAVPSMSIIYNWESRTGCRFKRVQPRAAA